MTDRAPHEHAEVVAQQIAEEIGDRMPPGYGFMLWLSSYGMGGYSTYVSSINREDAITMVDEWLRKMRAGRAFDDTDISGDCDSCGSKAWVHEVLGTVRRIQLCAKCWCEMGPSKR